MRLNSVVSALCFVLVTAAWAQLSTTATINGTVTDASQAVVPSATISVRNDATQVVAATQSSHGTPWHGGL
jgi:hypothetical protein